MAERGDRVTLSRPAIGLIVAGLVAAFGGGVAARSRVFGEAQAREARSIPIAQSTIGPPASEVAAAAVTAEQVHQLATAMSALQGKLDDTIKQVNALNERFARFEGEMGVKRP